jgi:hypothetical protein
MNKYEISKCPVCKKKIKVKSYIGRRGIFKGHKIVDLWKHKNCRKYFDLTILMNDLEKIRNKLKKRLRLK